MSTKGIEMPSGLELYPHNEKAYRKLLDMLSGTRRACIIHPTGTGKAFIAYRYAFRRTLIVFSLNIKPQYIPARYFSFCVLLTVLLVTLSIRSLQGKLFITDAQYMVATGRWIIANGHLPTTDPLSIHSELTYICQQYPICIFSRCMRKAIRRENGSRFIWRSTARIF